MPSYKHGNGNLEIFEPFKNVHHMSSFLTRTSINDPHWRGFVRQAHRYLKGEDTPPTTLRRDALKRVTKRHPYQLGGDILLDYIHQSEDGQTGSGVAEVVNTIAHSLSNTLGLPELKEVLFGKAEHKKMTDQQILFAKALNSTYKKMTDRPRTIGNLERLSQFDTPRYSVWDEGGNGQLLVTIHGTEINHLKDITDDAKILLGRTNIEDESVTSLFKLLDEKGLTFDVASHSLGSEFVMSAVKKHSKNVDEILLFNPASSGLQNKEILKERANNPQFSYFINQSDPVSHGIYQQMDKASIDRAVIGDYKFSPLTAHSMSQWVEPSSDIGLKSESSVEEA